MKKKNLFTKVIQFLTLALFVANIPLSAKFYNAICLTPKNKKQHVQFFADIHMGNMNMADQARPLIEHIEQDPENSCVIVESDETCATQHVSKIYEKSQFGPLFHIAHKCKEKGIETACVDCRIQFDSQVGDIISLSQTPEYFSVAEFLEVVDAEMNACSEYLTKKQKTFWQELQELCDKENLIDALLPELFAYKSATASETMNMSIVWFLRCLVDTKIIKTIKESDKENIYVVAGGFHTHNVCKHLQENGYSVCCKHGVSHDESAQLFEQYKNNPTELAANMPQVDIKAYFSDMAAHHEENKNASELIQIWPAIRSFSEVWNPTILV